MPDVYDSEARLEKFLEWTRKCNFISKDNKELILKFKDKCFVEGFKILKLLIYY